MISFERSDGRHWPSRFVVATIMVPVALLAVSLPANRVMGQYVAGRAVVDGAIEVSGTLMVLEALTWLLAVVAVLVALQTANTVDRPITAPIPAAAAGGVLGVVIAAGGLAPATSSLMIVGTGLVGMVIGDMGGAAIGHVILDPVDRHVSGDVDMSGFWSRMSRILIKKRPGAERISGDLAGVEDWQAPTWTGHTSSPGFVYWVVAPVFVAVNMGSADTRKSPVLVAMTVLAVAGWAMGYRMSRVRLEIGPSGLLVRSSILATPVVAVEVDRIESASVIEQGRFLPNQIRTWMGRWWWYHPGRLTISNGRGPAVLIALADGTELLLATPDAEVAATQLTSHLR